MIWAVSLKTISIEVLMNLFCNISSEITLLKLEDTIRLPMIAYIINSYWIQGHNETKSKLQI